MTTAQLGVLIAGDCPVCPGFGAAVAVASVETGHLFFACPACGCAWIQPPTGSVDSIDRPTHFAPAGFRLAVRRDFENANLLSLIVRTEPFGGIYDDFERVDGFVAGPSAG